jgi:hypothetical protein
MRFFSARTRTKTDEGIIRRRLSRSRAMCGCATSSIFETAMQRRLKSSRRRLGIQVSSGFQNDLSAGVVFGFAVCLLYLVERKRIRDWYGELAPSDIVGELVEA